MTIAGKPQRDKGHTCSMTQSLKNKSLSRKQVSVMPGCDFGSRFSSLPYLLFLDFPG